MSAQRCFTPWNWPIGRPNCTRTFAYSAAVSTHHCAMPIASAASSTAAMSCTRSVVTASRRSAGRLTPRGRGAPTRRVRSMLVTLPSRPPRRARTSAVDLAHDHVGEVPAEHRTRAAERERADRRAGRELGSNSAARARPRPAGSRRRTPSARTARARTHDRAPRPRRPARRARSPRRRAPRRRAARASPARRSPPRTRAGLVSRRARPAPPRAGCGVDEPPNRLPQLSCSSVMPMAMRGDGRADLTPASDAAAPRTRDHPNVDLRNGPVIAKQRPWSWMLANSTLPSGAKFTPVNSDVLMWLRANSGRLPCGRPRAGAGRLRRPRRGRTRRTATR